MTEGTSTVAGPHPPLRLLPASPRLPLQRQLSVATSGTEPAMMPPVAMLLLAPFDHSLAESHRVASVRLLQPERHQRHHHPSWAKPRDWGDPGSADM